MKNTPQVEQILLHGAPDMAPKRRRGFTDGWGWEIIAMAVSLACMASVIIILLKIEGKPLSYWTLFLSPSATLAIAITASKSTAAFTVAASISQCKWLHFRSGTHPLRDLDLFDEAARGPLGAIRLLISGVPWRIASIGALVTILALAVDTFVQQVVKLNPRDVGIDDGNALFAVNHGYFSTALPVTLADSSDETVLVQASSVDRFMPGAIYGGLFNTNSPRVFNCGSKCTWNETYVSLGFSSSCADVTAATFKGQNQSQWGRVDGISHGSTFLTPGGVNLSAEYTATSFQTVISVGGIYLLRSLPHPPEEAGQSIINKTRMYPELARIAILRTASDPVNNVIYLNKTEVTECTISLAAYRYSGISASGSDLTVSTEVIPLGDGLVTGNYTPPGYRPGSIGDDFVLSFQHEGLPTLQAAIPDLAALGRFFNSTRFSGNIYDGETQLLPPSGVGDAFHVGNMSQIVQNMTLSMTNYLRSSFNVTGRGLSIIPVVFITVEWKWLVLPIGVQLAALVFLFLTILDSRPRRNNPQQALWKSSTVAVLCYYMRITSEEGGRITGVLRTDIENLDDLRRLARNTRAKLD